MPTRKKAPAPKRSPGRASTAKRTNLPDQAAGPGTKGVSDEPQREDEYLSKFLRSSNPETKNKNADGKKKG